MKAMEVVEQIQDKVQFRFVYEKYPKLKIRQRW